MRFWRAYQHRLTLSPRHHQETISWPVYGSKDGKQNRGNMSDWVTMSDDDIEDVGGYVRTGEAWRADIADLSTMDR